MFPRRFFAGRYFAPRYWPDAAAAPLAPQPLVLVLLLSHETVETLMIASSRSVDLRLSFTPIADLTLRPTNTVALKLIDVAPILLLLTASDPIPLILEE